MSVNGFLVNNTVQKYNYESLENYNTPDFSTSSTYQVGDYVMYQGKLYKCTTEITTSGAWDSTKWSLAILSDDVADLKTAIIKNDEDIEELQNGLIYSTTVTELEITTSNQSIKNDGTFAGVGGFSFKVTIPSDCDYVDFVASVYMSNASAPYPVTAFTDSKGNILKTTVAGTYVNKRRYTEEIPFMAKYFYINVWVTSGTNSIYSGKRDYSIPNTINNLVETEFYPFSWTNRIYYWNAGTRSTDATRIGLAEIVQAKTNFKVSVTNDLDVSLIVFSSNVESVATEKRLVNWSKSAIVYKDEYFLLNVRKTDNSVIDPFEINNKLTIDKYDASNGSVIGVDFVRRPVLIEKIGSLSNYQAFCVYNGNYYSTNGENISKQDSSFALISSTDITVGHGNSFQLGSSHYAYISGWDNQNIYEIDLDTITLHDTIRLPTTGYTTAVVDDLNGIAYVFQRDTQPNTETNYVFMKYDYVNEQIISTRLLPVKFGAMQAADYYGGKIAVAYGLATNELPCGIFVFNTNGDLLSEYSLDAFQSVEIEGICFDRTTKKLLVSDVNKVVYTLT